VRGAIAAKVIIALGAFPVLVHAIFTAVTWVLGLMLPQITPLAGSWGETVRVAAVVATLLVAVRIAFGVCRRMWPEAVTR
jgi:hypothetical protein